MNCISNPPYNMKWVHPPFAQMQSRFSECEMPPENNSNYAFILTAMDETVKTAMILPNGVLSTENKSEKEIRRYLVEKNLIETVIACPDKMFEATSIPVCIMVFNKKKTDTYIRMIDMRETFTVEVREQNGQFGGASHENRTYVKNVKTFSDEQIDQVLEIVENKKDIAGLSKSVTIEDVVNENYNLTPSRYVNNPHEDVKHREYSQIINDLNRVITEKNGLKLTINETVAKAIGLYDVYESFKKSEEINEVMNKHLKFTGCEIIKENYISMSKNKNEVKFENNSKDNISTILLSIFQMWKQHVMYLNNEENRYLIELRDALLPDLMSGKIKIE
jgi:type I restriction-modification system DNA methylase subunit